MSKKTSRVKLEVRKPYLPIWKETRLQEDGSAGKRYVIIMGGRGGGRSYAASQFLTTKLFSPDYLRAAIMRSVQTDIRPSSWSELIDRIDEMEMRDAVDIKENAMTIQRGKNKIQAHGFKASSGSNSAKLKSLASYNTVWIEEAEEIGEEEFMKLDDSLRTKRGNITVILTLNTPPRNHWLIERFFDLKEVPTTGNEVFYEPILKKEREKDTLYIRTSYLDNLANLDGATVQRYESYQETNPNYYYQNIKGLSPEVVRGKIFSGWRRIGAVPFEAKLERIAIDWGWYPDPLAIVAVYRYQGGFILDEVAYSQRTSNDQAASIIRNYLQNKVTLIVADSAEPKSIEELQSYGLNVLPAEKGPGSLETGIKMMAGLQISVTERSHNIWKEYDNYAWREDRDGNPLNVPIDRHNHCFAPETLIYTTKGQIPIKDLVGKEGYLYTRGGRIERYHDVRQTREDAETVTLHFTDGKELTVTPDHLVLQPDGIWTEAGALKVGSMIQSGIYEAGKGGDNLRATAKIFRQYLHTEWQRLLSAFRPKEYHTLAPRGLGVSQRGDSRGLSHSPQRRGQVEQPHRELRTLRREGAHTITRETSHRRTEGGKARVGEEDTTTYEEMARLGNGTQVALRTRETNLCEKKTYRERLRALPFRLYNYAVQFSRAFLPSELQDEGATKTVERITRGREAAVYNLEVENTECLIANGVVAHNCIDAVRYALTDIKPHVDTESRLERRMKRLYSNRRRLTANPAR